MSLESKTREPVASKRLDALSKETPAKKSPGVRFAAKLETFDGIDTKREKTRKTEP